MSLTPRRKLQLQLEIVDKAIAKVVKEEQGAKVVSNNRPNRRSNAIASAATLSLASSSSVPLISSHEKKKFSEEKDVSFTINPNLSQPVICQFCSNEIESIHLEKHIQNECKNKIVSCPNKECGESMNRMMLNHHLKFDCIVTKKRIKLLEEAKKRKQKEIEEELKRKQDILSKDVPSSGSPAVKTVSVRGDGDQQVSSTTTLKVVECPLCASNIRESQLLIHCKEECNNRLIMCPNYGFGCYLNNIPFSAVKDHILNECPAEKQREEMCARSHHRNTLILCASCGEKVSVRGYRQHELKECINRLVPCKNQHLGCQVLVPLKDRRKHEYVDEHFARYSLYLCGHGSYLHLAETDIACPWTAEYWIYRPLPQAVLKMHLANIFLLLPSYLVAFAAECAIKEKVMTLVRALKQDQATARQQMEELRKLPKTLRAQRQNEILQRKTEQVNELMTLIPVYSEAVLAYVKAFQSLAICIEASKQCLSDINSEKFVRLPRDHPLTVHSSTSRPVDDIQFDFPGEIRDVLLKSNNYAATVKTAERDPPTSPSSPPAETSPPPPAPTVATSLDFLLAFTSTESAVSHYSKLVLAERAEKLGGAVFRETLTSLLDRPGSASQQTGISTTESMSSENIPSYLTDKEVLVKRLLAGNLDKSKRVMKFWFYLMLDPQNLLRLTTMLTVRKVLLHPRDVDAFLEKLRKEKEAPLQENTEGELSGDSQETSGAGDNRPQEENDALSVAGKSAVSNASSNKTEQFNIHEEHPDTSISIQPPDEEVSVLPEESEEMVELELEDDSPELAISLSDWADLLRILGRALKRDFDLLQAWRVEAGLLTPEKPSSEKSSRKGQKSKSAKKSAKKSGRERQKSGKSGKAGVSANEDSNEQLTDVTDAEEAEEQVNDESEVEVEVAESQRANEKKKKQAAKREKERQRRELKKLKHLKQQQLKRQQSLKRKSSKSNVSLEDTADLNDGQSLAESETLKEVDTPDSDLEDDDESAPSPTSNLKHSAEGSEVKLITRVTQLLKSNCGTEIVAESNSMDEHCHRSRICLSMFSGLSLLFDYDDQIVYDIYKLNVNTNEKEAQGSASVSEEVKHHYHLLVSKFELNKLVEMHGGVGFISVLTDSPSGLDAGAPGSEVRLPGNTCQPVYYGVKVPYGRFSHIALAVSDQPQNKATLYLDGTYISSVRNCAFPLPMLSLGGSPLSLFGFRGLLFDVRYWNHVRSELQLRQFMFKLVTLAHQRGGEKLRPSQKQRFGAVEEDEGLILWYTCDDGPVDPASTSTAGQTTSTSTNTNTNTTSKEETAESSNNAVKTAESKPAEGLSGAAQLVPVCTDATLHRFKTKILNKLSWEVRLASAGHDLHQRYPVPYEALLPLYLTALRCFLPKELAGDADALQELQEEEQQVEDALELQLEDEPNRRPASGGSSGRIKKTPSVAVQLERIRRRLSGFHWIDADTIRPIAPYKPPKAPTQPTSTAPGLRNDKLTALSRRREHLLEEALAKREAGWNRNFQSSRTHALPDYLLSELQNFNKPKLAEDATSSNTAVDTAVTTAAGDKLTSSATTEENKNDAPPAPILPTLPLPSYRAQNICPFEIYRLRLARAGRLLQKSVPCPKNCKELLRALDVRHHLKYACKFRYVACKYAFCNSVFYAYLQEEHENSLECAAMSMRDKWMNISLRNNSPVQCPMCSEEVPMRKLEFHQQQECIHRRVYCPRPDCALADTQQSPQISAQLLEHHLNFSCTSKSYRKQMFMVERARERHPYPKPWGVIVESPDSI